MADADGEPDWSVVLLELLKLEHCNIPAGAWGFFFPVTIALWRLFNQMTGGGLGEVHAIWVDIAAAVPSEVGVFGEKYLVRRNLQAADAAAGPRFLGAGGTWLVDRLEGDLMDAVEELAYAIVAVVPRERAMSGRLQPSEIGPLDGALVSRVARLAADAVRQYRPRL